MNFPFHFPALPFSVGTVLSGAIGAIGSAGSGDAGHTATIAAISGVIGGVIAILPAIIKARTEARKVEGDHEGTEHDKLVERIYKFHDAERASWQVERRAQRNRIERNEAITAIIRGSKHALAGELQYVVSYLNMAQAICVTKGVELPAFKMPDVNAINANEDSQIQKICGVPEPEDPPRQIPPANPMAPSV